MAIWSAGLVRRESAERAATWGGVACLLQAARMTFGNFESLSVADKSFGQSLAWFTGASILPVLIAVAGIRLCQGIGWMWGSIASFFMVLDLALYTSEPTSISGITAVVIKIALAIVILNGARGAFALQSAIFPRVEAAPSEDRIND